MPLAVTNPLHFVRTRYLYIYYYFCIKQGLFSWTELTDSSCRPKSDTRYFLRGRSWTFLCVVEMNQRLQVVNEVRWFVVVAGGSYLLLWLQSFNVSIYVVWHCSAVWAVNVSLNSWVPKLTTPGWLAAVWVSTATGWETGQSGIDSRRRQAFSLHHCVRIDSGTHLASSPVSTAALSSKVKRPGRETGHSSPSSAEAKKPWRHNPTLYLRRAV